MKSKKPKEKNQKKDKVIMLLAAALLLLVILILAFWYFRTNKKFSPEEATFRYSMGAKLEYSEDMKLVHGDNNATVVEDADKVQSDGVPIIYENEPKMILPVSMGYMRPLEEGGLNRVNYFSTVSYENGKVRICHNDIITEAKGGFLYDGKGTYIFLEEMNLQVGESTYKVQPLTYVQEVYKNSVEFYDVITGEYQYIIVTDADAIATSPAGYSVNLGTGVMTMDDTQRILFSDIEAMGAL
ncbi:MAG: hypothetical protein MR355_00975 [Lachnospiraceae bacterium]|nr:hypothetical protein [Lachnospiraceae bacterium]